MSEHNCSEIRLDAAGETRPVRMVPRQPERINSVDNTLRDRDVKYGNYREQFQWAQDAKGLAHQTPNWAAMPAFRREALELILTKISRVLHGDHAHDDSWHDIAGYANLGGGWKP